MKDKIQRRGFKKKTLKLYKKDKRFNKFKLRKLRKKQVQKYFKKRFRKKNLIIKEIVSVFLETQIEEKEEDRVTVSFLYNRRGQWSRLLDLSCFSR